MMNLKPNTPTLHFARRSILPRVDGFSREELAIAAYLQPLHSQLGAIARHSSNS